MFELHTTLAADTIEIGHFPLCRVLLMNNRSLPWVILVPQRTAMREVFELRARDQAQLALESAAIGEIMMREFSGHKLNTGALGNIVSQLHIHHVVRYEHDVAWPNPVWGNLPNKPYPTVEAKLMRKRLRKAFEACTIAFE